MLTSSSNNNLKNNTNINKNDSNNNNSKNVTINQINVDPERHLKKIKKIFGVSARIQKLAIRRKKSVQRLSKNFRNKELLANSKTLRTTRVNAIGSIQRYILDIVADLFKTTVDEIIEGMADSQMHINLLENFECEMGKLFLLFFYDLFSHPNMESGRFVHKNKHIKMKRAICSDGSDIKIPGKCVLVYRLHNNKHLDLRTIQEDCFFTTFIINKNESIITAISNIIENVHFQTCNSYKDYGLSKEWQKDKFLHDLKAFGQYLKCTDDTLKNITQFSVSHNLYKGYLLAPHQIKETSQNRYRVYEIEIIFKRWLRKIQIVLTQGQQIRRDTINVGPLNELEYWHQMLLRYASIFEFVSDKPFQNHLTCLILAKSKLVKKWKKIDNTLTLTYNEAKDNVHYIASLEKYWDPLYRCKPNEIIDHLPAILMALRFIYTKSRFYNTSDCVASFLVKITNQLTIACKNYITETNCVGVFTQNPLKLFEKIEICIDLLTSYHFVYDEVVKSMKNTANEIPWNCSPMFIFGIMETFIARIKKIKIIIEVNEKYSILNKIRISGMEIFLNQIQEAYRKISTKPYDILDQRIKIFEIDYNKWNTEVENTELGMQKFIKDKIDDCPSSETILLILKRFEHLHLDCLCLDRRYLDVAVIFEKELDELKDVYNFERENPPISRCIPPVIGRIMWIRSLQKKIDGPMDSLRRRKCVIEHRKAQMSVKYYNFLSEIFLHYEMQHHKAWYDYVNEIEEKLSNHILIKNSKTNLLEVNFHSSIYQLIRESEGMLKLDLAIPYLSQIAVFCKDKILNAKESLKNLILRNNNLRTSIDMILLNISRPLLRRLELAFKPGLSTIQWTSKHLDDYFEYVDLTLTEISDFVKKISDIKTGRIDEILELITEISLIYLPDEPMRVKEFLDMNVKHRQNVEKIIELKSLSIEKSTVELINEYVSLTNVEPFDESGKRLFQLPITELNEDNRRIEELLPIDKYDWLCFDKIYRPVQIYSESDKNIHFFKNYEDMHYGLAQLHIDCMDVFSYFTSQIIAAMVKCIKRSIDQLKQRTNLINVSSSTSDDLVCTPIILTDMKLDIPICRISPSLENIQNNFALTIRNVIETFYAVSTWGKQAKTEERKKRKPLIDEIRHERSFFYCLSEHLEVLRILASMDGGLLLLQPDFNNTLLKTYNTFSYLWDVKRDENVKIFAYSNPLAADICDKFNLYDDHTKYIEQLPNTIQIGAITIQMDLVYESIIAHSKQWKFILGNYLSEIYRKRLNKVYDFIIDVEHILNGKLNDLDDVRIAMDCLTRIRESSIEVDMELGILIEVYALFTKFNIYITPDDYERVYSLRYNFDNMIIKSKEISKQIVDMQQPLLKELIDGIAQFKIDIKQFNLNMDTKGPKTIGISPKEANDRTFLFQHQLDELWSKYEMYTSGEHLFGLPITDYPILHKRKSELELLTELYSLYIVVLKSINGYYDVPWAELNTDQIIEEMANYQLKFQNLPNGMETWNGYNDLKKLIFDFNETCPLLKLMTSEAMKERHWDGLDELMNFKFDVENSKTTLGTVMQAPILTYKNDVLDICKGAEKERGVEIKLRQITNEWSNINIELIQYKSRGEILLDNTDILEIIQKLEMSLVIMNALDGDSFNRPFKKEITLWLLKLNDTKEILNKWLIVQNLWVQLEGIFIGGDIARQLPAETKRFRYIDKNYIKLVLRAREILNIVEICTNDETMFTMLPYLTEQLESLEKLLKVHLDQKQTKSE